MKYVGARCHYRPDGPEQELGELLVIVDDEYESNGRYYYCRTEAGTPIVLSVWAMEFPQAQIV